jgi:hypothetical protein
MPPVPVLEALLELTAPPEPLAPPVPPMPLLDELDAGEAVAVTETVVVVGTPPLPVVRPLI